MPGRYNVARNSHTAPAVAGTGSRARSVEAYYPWYPPPVFPEGMERSTYSGFTDNPPASSSPSTMAPVVKRNNLRMGDVTNYTDGAVPMRAFSMVATGQVPSSRFQIFERFPKYAQFNMWLYRAAKGYPQNLHLSEKVPTLPTEVLNPNLMQPRPRITRTIFTKRSFSSAPSIPAKSSNA